MSFLEKMKNKKILAAFIVCAAMFVLVLLATILMVTNFNYISYDSKLMVRYIFIYVCGFAFLFGLGRLLFAFFQKKNVEKAIAHSYIAFIVGELMAIGISAITITIDYSINLRLLEDGSYLLVRLAIIFLICFGFLARDKKKTIIVMGIIIGLTLAVTALDLIAFATNTELLSGGVEEKMLRDVDFGYVLSSVGLAFPYVAVLLFANAFSSNEVKEEGVSEEEKIEIIESENPQSEEVKNDQPQVEEQQ